MNVKYEKKKRYVNIYRTDVYAVYYRARGELFYNINFIGGTQVILLR
jgi:hypothetical protein